MMKRWNLVLVCLTFFLTIFGTFMTRSGAVQSVHAFGEDNVLALQFIVFMAVIGVVSVGLIVFRSNKLASKSEFDSFYSREFAFLLNNWILLGCAFFVLFATMFPTISEALDGSRVSVGIAFFNKWMTPLGLVLLFLAGAAPLLAWRKTTRERLWQQFMFPLAFAAITIVVLVVAVPGVAVKTSIFSDTLSLPVALVNFGLCAFTIGSIAQEFIRGAMVRRRQTGSDPFTSMIGLVLSKRRKYGGYIVHLGVVLCFVGFAGKAYDRMVDRTIEAPASVEKIAKFGPDGTVESLPPNSKASFAFGSYVFLYERLISTADDHKDAVTAQVSIWKDGKLLNTVYPAKWDYHRGEEATTEVAITVRLQEDVYVVLTGYDLDSQLANFRVFINPLISWVWIGFLVFAFGTLICLIPQGVVDRLSVRPKSRVGRAGEVGMLAVILFGLSAGLASQAHAQGGEHIPAGGGMGDDGIGWAARNRPDTGTSEKAMKEILCVCGCPRESVFDCKCKTAADLRGQIMEMVNGRDPSGKPLFDLNSPEGRQKAYDAVLTEFVSRYGGEQVLATPRSKFSWLFPSLAVVGGLGLIFVVGRRMVGRGKAVNTAAVAAKPVEDEAYTDKLDDELAGVD